jgi:hypothetical protein
MNDQHVGIYAGWGNNEQQYYTESPDNAQVTDGLLKLTALRQSVSGKPYSSARLSSLGLQSFAPSAGASIRVAARIKLPQGKHML